MENAQPEPSMEEILASIRRIISEDEEEAVGGEKIKPTPPDPAPVAKSAEKPAALKPAAFKPEVVAKKPDPVEDDDPVNPHLETEDVEMIKKNVAAAVAEETDGMLDKTSADAASAAFQSLSATVRVSEGEGRTLEELVVEMLRPMVKTWLDANLPAIVEEKVEEEIQRVARRRS